MTHARRRLMLAVLAACCITGLISAAARAQTTGSGTPFQQNVTCTIAADSSFCSAKFTVPAGKVLVIQSVSAYRLGPNSSTANAFLETEFQNSLATYPLAQLAVASATPFPGTTLALTAYAQTGAKSFFEIYRGSESGQESEYFTISGYLIPN